MFIAHFPALAAGHLCYNSFWHPSLTLSLRPPPHFRARSVKPRSSTTKYLPPGPGAVVSSQVATRRNYIKRLNRDGKSQRPELIIISVRSAGAFPVSLGPLQVRTSYEETWDFSVLHVVPIVLRSKHKKYSLIMVMCYYEILFLSQILSVCFFPH